MGFRKDFDSSHLDQMAAEKREKIEQLRKDSPEAKLEKFLNRYAQERGFYDKLLEIREAENSIGMDKNKTKDYGRGR